jgi:hypothetical protein
MEPQGYTFTPGQGHRLRQPLNAAGTSPYSNVSEALQILALHLPRIIGGAPIAPDDLLRPLPGRVGTLPGTMQRMTQGTSPVASAPRAVTSAISSMITGQPSSLRALASNALSAPFGAVSFEAPLTASTFTPSPEIGFGYRGPSPRITQPSPMPAQPVSTPAAPADTSDPLAGLAALLASRRGWIGGGGGGGAFAGGGRNV